MVSLNDGKLLCQCQPTFSPANVPLLFKSAKDIEKALVYTAVLLITFPSIVRGKYQRYVWGTVTPAQSWTHSTEPILRGYKH